MYRRYTVPGFDVLSGVWWKARFQNDKAVVGLQPLHAVTDFFDAVWTDCRTFNRDDDVTTEQDVAANNGCLHYMRRSNALQHLPKRRYPGPWRRLPERHLARRSRRARWF